MDNHETVCAVVVTYNRKKILLECLEALKRQSKPLDGIYMIDNASTDGTPKVLMENNYITHLPPEKLENNWKKDFFIPNLTNKREINFHYVRMCENTGGAGGFHEGIKEAYKKGYDWLWIMDDDAEPEENALFKISNYFEQKGISALANMEIDINGNVLCNQRGYFNYKNVFNHILKPINSTNFNSNIEYLEIDHASFVGIIIKKQAIKQIGFPRKDFFIHYDDLEYCIRLRNVGKILLIKSSIIIHKDINKKSGIRKKILGKCSLREPYNEFWITYYNIRNLIWLGKRYSSNKTLFYLLMLKEYFSYIIGIILFDNMKIKRIYFTTEAFLDGLRGNFDNKKPLMLLYG